MEQQENLSQVGEESYKHLIGLSGPAGSGKDFVAKILYDEYYAFTTAFADPVKRVCKDLFNFSYEQLWGSSEERDKPDFRYKLPYNEDDKKIIKDLFKKKLNTIEEVVLFHAKYPLSQWLTPRMALQKVGEEMKKLYENIWIDKTFQYIDTASYEKDPKIACISDVRFINEFDVIKSRGGKLIRIKRDKNRLLTKDVGNHISEQEQKLIPDEKFDYILYNSEEKNMIFEVEKMLKEINLM